MKQSPIGFRAAIWILTVSVLLLAVEAAMASTPMAMDYTFSPDEAYQKMIGAMSGGYQVVRGASSSPTLPKGFPQWGMSPEEALKCLGKGSDTPSSVLDGSGIVSRNFVHRFNLSLLFLDDRFVGISCMSFIGDERELRTFYGWKKTETNSNEPAGALLRTTFVPISGHMRHKVYSWDNGRGLRFYVTEKAAKACGVIR